MQLVFNLKSEKLRWCHLPTEFRTGDVYLFASGASQICFHCRHGIISGDRAVLQRRESEGVMGIVMGFNDRYHIDCTPNWLIPAVEALLSTDT